MRDSLTIIALWGLMFVSSTQYLSVFPLLPLIGEVLNIPDSWLGLFITVYSISMLSISLCVGLISDRIGRKSILFWGSLGMSFTLLLHFNASGFWSLVIVRILTGMFAGFLSGAVITYLRDKFEHEKRGWIAGKIYTGSAVGQIIGVPFAIMFAQQDVRIPFIYLGIGMLLVSFLILKFVPAASSGNGVALPALRAVPAAYKHLLKSKTYIHFCSIYFSVFFSVAIFLTYFPVWIEMKFNYSQQEIAFAFLLGGLAGFVSNPIVGKISDWIGRRKVILWLSVILAGLFGVAMYTFNSKSGINIFFFLIMFMLSGRTLSIQNFSSDLSRKESRGLSMGFLLSTGHLGTIFGSALSGPAFDLLGFKYNMILAGVASMFVFYIVKQRLPHNLKERKYDFDSI